MECTKNLINPLATYTKCVNVCQKLDKKNYVKPIPTSPCSEIYTKYVATHVKPIRSPYEMHQIISDTSKHPFFRDAGRSCLQRCPEMSAQGKLLRCQTWPMEGNRTILWKPLESIKLVVKGFGSSGRLLGLISAYPGTSPTSWCRVMARKHVRHNYKTL